MPVTLLDMPVELRLNIYSHLFGNGKVILDAGNYSGPSYILPRHARPVNHSPRSSQLLRVSKSIYAEALPELYANTSFHVTSNTFAGNLPVALTDNNTMAPYARKIVWQLGCDMLKKVYCDDSKISDQDMAAINSLELRCRAESWRESYCGDLCDRKAFIAGRDQMIEYCKLMVEKMGRAGSSARLVADWSCLGKGEVRLRATRSKEALGSHETVIDCAA